MKPHFLCAVSTLLLLSAHIPGQCSDPVVPQAGFALTRLLNQPIKYLDGAQTLMDVRYPSARPGACGWPVIFLIHGLGGRRAQMSANAEFFAAQGYLTVTYDVRGQGDALKLNPESLGTEIIGRSERLDLAEVVGLVKTRFGNGIADVTRLGITGFSQGAAHSWAAAAWSGRQLPATNNRGITTFPVFKAAYPIGLAPLSSELLILDGKAFSQSAVTTQLAPPQVIEYEPAFHLAVITAMAKGDTAAAAAIFDNDPWRQDPVLLKTSSVPVMVNTQWNDQFTPVDPSVRALDSMPKTTPTRAFLSTYGGHESPVNLRQVAQSRSFALRWFDRFMKDIKNQVDTEPRFVTGVVPESLAQYRNRDTLLWHRYSSSWPPAKGTTRLEFYLRQNQTLSTQAPTTAEPPETIRHRVNTGWDMARYINGGGNPAQLAQAVVLDSVTYDSPPLGSPIEILGSPSIVLEVSPQGAATDYQLHCALYQVHGYGGERYLQSAVGVVTGNANAQRLTIDFGDLDAYVPAGDSLRLKIQNLTPRPLPGSPPTRPFVYHTVPFFVAADVDIEHTAARTSWLQVPVAQTIQPALTSATLDYDTRAATDVVFNLDGTQLVAGATYVLAFGASGISPGTGLPLPGGGTALLNTDAVTTGLLGLLGTAFLPNGAGTLDSTGRAVLQPRLALSGVPALGSLVGLRLNALALVTSRGRFSASNPLDLFFR